MDKSNLNLLLDLCSVQSSSSDDKDITEYLKKYINEKLFLDYTEDNYGNIYVTKGDGKNGFKAIVSHTDTVHKIYDYRKVFCDNGYVYAMGTLDKDSVLTQVGIGGDDRVGNFVCLQALQDFDDIKAVFFRFEETGCKGSKQANMAFFDDCNFVIQADRKGYGDFIRNSKGIEMCSDEFVNDMKSLREKYGYDIISGISTDVNQLKENGLKVCAINLGCGYYYPHSDKEVIYLPNVIACYSMISEMFEQFGNKRYKHLYEKPVYLTNYTKKFDCWDGDSWSGFDKHNRTTANKKSFSNTSKNNFFNSRLIEDLFIPLKSSDEDILDMLTEDRYKDFWKIEGDRNIFYYTDTQPIFVNKSVIYNPGEDILYNLKDNCYIVNKNDIINLKKEMRITDTETEFVFSTLYDYWIIRNESIWDDTLETWILKDETFK